MPLYDEIQARSLQIDRRLDIKGAVYMRARSSIETAPVIWTDASDRPVAAVYAEEHRVADDGTTSPVRCLVFATADAARGRLVPRMEIDFGTGDPVLRVVDSRFRLDPAAGGHLELKSPGGAYFRLAVNASGQLTATAAPALVDSTGPGVTPRTIEPIPAFHLHVPDPVTASRVVPIAAVEPFHPTSSGQPALTVIKGLGAASAFHLHVAKQAAVTVVGNQMAIVSAFHLHVVDPIVAGAGLLVNSAFHGHAAGQPAMTINGNGNSQQWRDDLGTARQWVDDATGINYDWIDD